MIDIHIIKYNINPKYFDQCLKSLETNKNINIYFVDGYENHIGKGRYDGYKKGTSKYVSKIDPDDFVAPGIYDKMLEFMENYDTTEKICGVYAWEEVIYEDGTHKGFVSNYKKEWKRFDLRSDVIPNNCFIMKREYVEKYLNEIKKWRYRADSLLQQLITLDGIWITYPEIGYYWRHHSNNTFNRPETVGYTLHAKDFIKHVFLARNFEDGKRHWLSYPKSYKWYSENIDSSEKS